MRAVVVAAMALAGDLPLPAQSTTTAFVRGEEAFMQANFSAADSAYRQVLQQDTLPAHRATAAQTLANIAWRVRADTTGAAHTLAEADTIPGARAALRLERARMLQEHGAYARARDAASAALRAATRPADRTSATVAIAESVIGPHRDAAVRGCGHPSATTEPEADSAGVILADLRAVVNQNPGTLDAAKSLIELAAVAHDGPAMLDGWRSYYLIGTGDSARGPLRDPRLLLATVLPHWTARGGHPDDDRRVMRALADSRLFDAAAIVAQFSTTDAGPTHPQRADIVRYAGFIDCAQRITDEYYRETALGQGDSTKWVAQLTDLARALWPQLSWNRAIPPFVFDSVAPELERRFGALVNLGYTAGLKDLHWGHAVVDEHRRVAQYGHSATVRFIALDAMVSNGFQSWAWDGRAAHGGWGSKRLIVQVRAGYSEAPIRTWASIMDTARTREGDQEIATDSAADVARARATPVAYFPSVESRLRRDGEALLLDSLRHAGLEGRALQENFQRLFGIAITESSIFAHEGRHAIDDAMGATKKPEELEFRAKLSQVAFAPRPRLAFGGIFSANLGDETPHGKANARVARGLLAWMQKHQDEVRGLNRTSPLLPQFPLLSDAQLRAAVVSIDPLAHRQRPTRS